MDIRSGLEDADSLVGGFRLDHLKASLCQEIDSSHPDKRDIVNHKNYKITMQHG